MEQRKIRLIKSRQANASEAWGITIPPDVAFLYQDTYFTFLKTREGILLLSGTKIELTDKDIENSKLEDFKI